MDPSLVDRLRPWLDAPATAGVFLDFDGTLASIVAEPDRARPLPGTVDVLARLSRRIGRVAVISGRPGAYLAEHLRGAGATELIGLYGMERVRGEPPVVEVAADAAGWAAPVAAAASDLEAAAPAGVAVERKGLAVTVHYRQAPEQAGWVTAAAGEAAAGRGLVAHPGKLSMEIRPPVPTDKGTVVRGLAAGLASVCFVGDDVGDLPAFAALDDVRRAGTTTLAIAVRSTEAPPALLGAADAVVDGPADVLALLGRLAAG